jgi:hypothetical protein
MVRCGSAFRASRSLWLGEEAGALLRMNDRLVSVVGLCVTTLSPGFSINLQAPLRDQTRSLQATHHGQTSRSAHGGWCSHTDGRSPTSAGIDKRSDKP